MKKIKVFRKKYPAPEEMVHGSHSSVSVVEQTINESEYSNYLKNFRPNEQLHTPDDENYHEGVERSLSEIQNFDDLTPEEKTHVKDYTSNSKPLNNILIDSYNRNEKITGDSYIGPTKSKFHVGSLDSAIEKFTLPKMSLFHGASFDPTRLGRPTADGHHIVHIPAYTSTSYNHALAAEFFAKHDYKSSDPYKKNMLEIKVPEGHPGLHVGKNSSISDENEVLLPRGITLKIKSNPTTYNKSSPLGLKVWEAHPVPDGEDPETWKPPSK